MPPPLATLLCIIFIFYLFWTDREKKEGVSNALWVPFFWMFFAAGRFPAEWLQLSGSAGGLAASFQEGNPVNAAAFFFLIAAGVFILSSRRNIDWAQFLTGNKLFLLYLLYCLMSILWSDYSFVSFKRWTKEFGNLVMVLVILTEDRPYKALGVLLRRLGFLWLPLSVLFIKYYPALGRGYAPEGGAMYTGIGEQKNQLGLMCMISTIYYAWHYFLARKDDFRFWGRDNIVDLMLLAMLAWLFHMAHSATSLACAVAAVAILLASRITIDKPGRIMTWAIVAVLLFFALNSAVDLKAAIIHMLGRKQDLTDRTQMWATISAMAGNHWVGVGYQSFWAGDRLKILWEKVGVGIIQAHNGYLEQYLDLGYIGVAFIIAIMLSGVGKVRRLFDKDYASAVLMFSFIIAAALRNYTEASFYAMSNMWLLLILAVIEIPERQWAMDATRYSVRLFNSRPTAFRSDRAAAAVGRPGHSETGPDGE